MPVLTTREREDIDDFSEWVNAVDLTTLTHSERSSLSSQYLDTNLNES